MQGGLVTVFVRKIHPLRNWYGRFLLLISEHLVFAPTFSIFQDPLAPSAARGSRARLLASDLFKDFKQFGRAAKARAMCLRNLVRLGHRRTGFGVGRPQVKRHLSVSDHAHQEHTHSVRQGQRPIDANVSVACALICSSTRTWTIVVVAMVVSF